MSQLIMMLSGEDTERRHRSRKTIDVHYSFFGQAPILISGSHSGYLGRKLPTGMTSECEQAKDFLVSNQIPEKDITLEYSSLDTLGNFYFSYPLIREEQNQVYLVTDRFHMKRSLWCSRLVFGSSKEFIPCLTGQTRNTGYQKLIENLQIVLLKGDMMRYGVAEGDYEALGNFMYESHPFYYVGEQKPSLFGVMVRLFSNKTMFKMLPTQKQAYKGLEN